MTPDPALQRTPEIAAIIAFGVVGVVFLGAFPYLMKGLLLEDRFLNRLSSEFPELWFYLGKPRGWQWAPSRHLKERFPDPVPEIERLRFDWLGRAVPSWMDQYPSLLADYQAVRAFYRFWNFKIMPIFVALMALIGAMAIWATHWREGVGLIP
jgi:hypothetical protein